jgi:hypothetical protein
VYNILGEHTRELGGSWKRRGGKRRNGSRESNEEVGGLATTGSNVGSNSRAVALLSSCARVQDQNRAAVFVFLNFLLLRQRG